MSNNKLAKLLTDTLPPGRRRLFNPWRDRCADDLPSNGPDAKLARLAAHLDCNPRFILCGEAPSYRGCRHSGIAFTSEHLLSALQMLVKEFPLAIVVAVGRKAERSLKSMGILYKPVRHPAYGGGPEFARQLELLVRGAHG